MKKAFVPLLVISLLIGCKEKKQDKVSGSDSTANTTTGNQAADNQLTAEEASAGYRLLFNGTSQDGWRIFKNKENNSWEVVKGTLHCKPFDGAEKRSDLMTTEQFENFDLSFDWKISPQGNSGVIFRVTEEYNEPYFSGPEYQVIDDEGYPGDLTKTQLTAANYDMHAVPDDKPVKPVGEWNTSRLIVNGSQVEHYLNGSKVLEYEINSGDWKKRRDNSKWKDTKGYGLAKSGHIDLQDHGNEVWFRNIKIKKL